MARSQANYKLIGVELGNEVKYTTSLGDIDRLAAALFPVKLSLTSSPNPVFTSARAAQVYGWILSVAESDELSEDEKREQVAEFARGLLPENSPALNRILRRLRTGEAQQSYDFPWSLLHPWLEQKVRARYEGGHFADAVESAIKEVNARVKRIVKDVSGKELDGASLMNTAFSQNKPIVLLADQSSETGRNIQQGFMQIFAGAMTGVRNPAAHENIEMTAEEALHLLFLASLLMCKLDAASIPAKARPEPSLTEASSI